ncbi:MAG: phosphate acyltransferase PlsX [Candidatus Limiplasma sp.]|nr:phosphate acyltransferase PlsX [Candidatus Limiplasma sp.]MEA5145866.1 phosphate acyltransferase PlsX [Candidatus Limiplasma sp.]
MKIYLDVMGGDHAPAATVAGAREALERFAQLHLELAGPLDLVTAEADRVFADAPALRQRVTFTDCPEVITNDESPVMAVRKKKGSAIVDGMLKLRDRQVDAFVSAGSTGAVLAGGMFRLGRIKGIERPALAPLLPNGKDFFLLIDCGANVDCRPEYLAQFALMGNAYMQGMRGIQNPRIGLVNNGAESEKGCALTKAAYELLAESGLNFIGNVEGRDITGDVADVVVCDGFVGNVILKFMEGVAGTLMGIIKQEITADVRGKLGGLLAKPAFKRVKKTMDYTEVGGAPLLGVSGNVVKAHGSSNAHAIACAIRQAVDMVTADVVGKIEARLVSAEPQAAPAE